MIETSVVVTRSQLIDHLTLTEYHALDIAEADGRQTISRVNESVQDPRQLPDGPYWRYFTAGDHQSTPILEAQPTAMKSTQSRDASE